MGLTLLKYAVLLFLILVYGYYLSNYFIDLDEPSFDIRAFNGDVVSIEGNHILLNGAYSTPETVPADLLSERDFSFRVDEKTRFEKTEIGWPTWDEVAANGGQLTFDIADLPHTRTSGSLDDLENLSLANPGTTYVEATFQSSVYNAVNPVASSVFYKSMTPPLPASPTPIP